MISAEAWEPYNRSEDGFCKELQYPCAVAQTAEETGLQVSVRGLGLLRGCQNENSLALNLFKGL